MKKFVFLAAMLLVAFAAKGNNTSLQSSKKPVKGEQIQVQRAAEKSDMSVGSSEMLNWQDDAPLDQVHRAPEEAKTVAVQATVEPVVQAKVQETVQAQEEPKTKGMVSRKASRAATEAAANKTNVETEEKKVEAKEPMKVIPRHRRVKVITSIIGDEDHCPHTEVIHHVHHHHHHHYVDSVEKPCKAHRHADLTNWEHANVNDADEECDNHKCGCDKDVHHLHVDIHREPHVIEEHHIVEDGHCHGGDCHTCATKKVIVHHVTKELPTKVVNVHHHIHHDHVHHNTEQHPQWFDLRPKKVVAQGGQTVIHHHHHVHHKTTTVVHHEEIAPTTSRHVIVHHVDPHCHVVPHGHRRHAHGGHRVGKGRSKCVGNPSDNDDIASILD